MRRITAVVLLAVLAVLAGAAGADEFDEKARPLFDGQSLTGWEGNAYWFRIVGDAIVAGRLDEKIPHNQFLCTTERFADFELRLEAKLVGEGQNAGIQFRSQRVAGSHEVAGYQADIGRAWDRPVWGALYDEARRREMLAEPEAEATDKLVEQGGWNRLRIRCEGPRIQIFLNGQQTVDYTETDDSISRSGVIGLQIHGGPPTEAWYRNIRVLEL